MAALEFALVGLPFVLLLLGLLEFGRGLHIRNAVDAAADRGQRAVLIGADEFAIETEIRDGFLVAQPERLTITQGDLAVAGANYHVIQLTYPMQLLLPAPIGGTISIASTRRVATP